MAPAAPCSILEAESDVDGGHLEHLDLLLERFESRLVGLRLLQVTLFMLRQHFDAQGVVLVLQVADVTLNALH